MEGTLEITFTVPLSCPFFVLDSVKETKLQAVVTVIGDVSNFFLDNSPKRENFLNAVFKVECNSFFYDAARPLSY